MSSRCECSRPKRCGVAGCDRCRGLDGVRLGEAVVIGILRGAGRLDVYEIAAEAKTTVRGAQRLLRRLEQGRRVRRRLLDTMREHPNDFGTGRTSEVAVPVAFYELRSPA